MAKHLKIEDLTKSTVWSLSESDLNQMLIDGKKRDTYSDYETHYMNIIRPVFDIQYLDRSDRQKTEKLEAEGFDIFSIPSEGENNAIAIRKHQIKKITDLTLENISHLLPGEVLHLIEENLGTGWQGLPLAIQDIIESAFYVDSSVVPSYALHRKGGLIEKRKADGYEVLEVARGTWTEAIFLKSKPKVERKRYSSEFRENIGSSKEEEEEDTDDEEVLDDGNDMDGLTIDEGDEADVDLVEDVDHPSLEDIDVIEHSIDENMDENNV